MPITDCRDEKPNAGKDVRRHHDKVKDAVKKQLPDIISEENIITQDNKGRKIRVPVKSIDIPDLRHGKRKKSDDGEGGGKTGIGQGPGSKGKEIGRRPGQQEGEGQGGGKAGNQPGEDMLEAEFSIEEIIEMMFEDFGLPNLMKKDLATVEVSLGYKLAGSERVGPMVLLKKRPTAKEAFKTFWGLMGALQGTFPERSELDCFAAIKKSGGDMGAAEKFLSDPNFQHSFEKVDPFPIIGNDDLRFFDVQEKKTSETNAVVFAMLDVSGSMTDEKKYAARAILFWLVTVLRNQYTNVEIRFITHHTEAKLAEEKDFFRTMESGGTEARSAFALANETIKEKYPTNLWNVYAFYFSDGDDWKPAEAADEMKKMIESGVNMIGFAQIVIGEYYASTTHLMSYIEGHWPVEASTVGLLEVLKGKDGYPFIAAKINSRNQVFEVLREFLRKNR